jgi:hypothetical protein
VFISLPALFRQKDTAAPHGLVLKPKAPNSADAKEASAVKTVLLTPKIDVEIDIPEDGIHTLPQALAGEFVYFRGAYCGEANIILILDPDKLAGAML